MAAEMAADESEPGFVEPAVSVHGAARTDGTLLRDVNPTLSVEIPGSATKRDHHRNMDGHQNFDVTIVGGGFSGVYQLYNLRNAGFSVKLLEAGSGLGGVWYWNCYPGARVDSDFSMYQFSLEELWRDWDWTERFPGQQEILAYFDYVDKKLDLSRDISFNTRVVSASFNTATDHWSVNTDIGVTVNSRFLILCTGFASKPLFPDTPGLGTFQGAVHHTSLWPKSGIDMTGKHVGVIGTGASGVQVIQEAGRVAAHLTVFQRTPNFAIPMNQHPVSVATQTKMKEEKYPILFKRREQTFVGFEYDFIRRGMVLDTSPEERYLLYDDLWSKGGFLYWFATYLDIVTDEKLNDEVYAFWRKKVLERVRDPEMQRKLAPEKPPHPFGVKNISLEQWYYDVYNQPNVVLVTLNENPIIEVTPKGVKMQDGVVHELDVLVLATGFDAITGGISQIDIKGTDGISIGDRWKTGLSTYLGMTVAGYPNMFFPYGPHAPTALCNGPSCAEVQGNWIIDCLTYLRQHKYSRIDATQEASAAWVQHISDIASIGLWDRAKSFYRGVNVPGKRIEHLNFNGGLARYNTLVKERARDGYAGFTLTSVTGTEIKL